MSKAPAVIVVNFETDPDDAAWMIPALLTRVRSAAEEVLPGQAMSVCVAIEEPARQVREITDNW